MYESPVTVMIKNITHEIKEKREEYIIKEVQKCGVVVNKDELIRALQYDRQQYDNGYADGYEQGLEDGRQKVIDAIKEIPL